MIQTQSPSVTLSLMGKAQKLKAERAAARLAMSERAPLIMLKQAVVVIGNTFGPVVDCANAAAFLKLTADRLGGCSDRRERLRSGGGPPDSRRHRPHGPHIRRTPMAV